MKYYLSLVLILAAAASFAQNLKDTATNCVSTIVLTDTIHVSGIVTYSSDKPAKGVRISTNLWNFGVSTFTDSSGRFRLENVRLKDTLFILSTNFARTVPNNGSRYLKITIPPNTDSRIIKTTIKIEGTSNLKKEAISIKLTDSCACCFYSLEVSPEFPGGYKKLHNFIRDRVIYPQKALKDNIEGEVVVQFMIGEDGTPKDFTVISGVSKECDEAAMNALKGMPKWRPGIFYGRPAEYPQKLAIQFSLAR